MTINIVIILNTLVHFEIDYVTRPSFRFGVTLSTAAEYYYILRAYCNLRRFMRSYRV